MKKDKGPKLPAGITQEFVEEIDSLGPDNLKTRIVQMQGQIEETRAFLNCDEERLPEEQLKGAIELKEMKASYNEAAAPARETVRTLRARTKWIVEALKKNGAL